MLKILILLLFCQFAAAETGIASYYSVKNNHGRRTRSGIPLDNSKLTCASPRYKDGTKLKITNLRNGKSVICLVTDHFGGYKKRVIDVSVATAKALDFYKDGLTRVKIEVL